MNAAPSALAGTWDPEAAALVPSDKLLTHLRHILRSTALPATIDTIDKASHYGRQRLKNALAALETRGEVTLNARGDAVFAITELTT